MWPPPRTAIWPRPPCAAPESADTSGGFSPARKSARERTAPRSSSGACARLRSNKKDTVIFEDALHAIETAKAAGFRVCGVYDDSAREDQEAIRRIADYYITSFEEMFETNVPE